jgi:ankyrin repeat protein
MSTRQAELEKELFSACEAGDVDRVRRAIAAGVDPKKAINEDELIAGETPLHIACRY